MGKKRVIKKGGENEEDTAGGPEKKRGAGVLRKVSRGIANIQATYNNTILSVADEKGDIIAWSSAGSLGFSGAKKATPYAAARVAEAISEKIRKAGVHSLSVKVSGVGSGRDSAIRALANQGFEILNIRDITPLPHNGPRPKKVRRV